ncbi:DUF541 domain-containing protein [Methanofollis formosanus]|uniref:DUF541 domain-containing protein n=1 Tax=Methanofollis formosanus TaxID=299308 RepID=A0A8G1A3I2_9EURY|nr:SIMPL domain-containing protein [Methanofollis formosanus]QYZ79734.1 DUF541 domain-containing protein [Methanofollis formosanus]
MRTRTLILCTALMVLVAAGIWSASAAATTTTDERLIHASGTGEVTTTPDRAVISFGVETENTDPKAAQAANSQAMNKVINALKAAGIASEDLKTTGYNIWHEKPDNDKPFRTQAVIYHVSNTLQVTLKDVNRAGEVIDIAVANDVNQVNGLYFTLSPEKEQALRAEALTQAVEHARSDADAVAAAAGVIITGPKEVTIGGTYIPYYERSFNAPMAMDAAAGMPTPIEVGEAKVTASVSISYLCA